MTAHGPRAAVPAATPPGDGSRRLLRQGGWYALGNLLVKASGLVLAPIYLNPAYLSTEGFGYFALLMVTSQLGIGTVGLGLGRGLLKFLVDPAYQDRYRTLLATTLFACIGLAGAAIALCALFSASLAGLLLDDPGRKLPILLTALYIGLKVVGDIPLIALRAAERARLFVLILAAEAAILLIAVYELVAVLHYGLTGLMAAYVISAGFTTFVLLAVNLAAPSWHFDRTLLGPLLRFGSPLVLAGLSAWALNFSDRYLIKWLIDVPTTGLYEWAARLAGTLNMLFVQSFQFAFSVIGLKAMHGENVQRDLHRETFRHYTIWSGWAVLALALGSFDLTRILSSNPFYLRAAPLVFLLSLGFMAYGIHYVIANLLYAAGRSRVLSLVALSGAALNVALNLFLIPFVGAIGAALATYLAYLGLALGHAWFVRRYEQVEFPWRVYVLVVGIVLALYLTGRFSMDLPILLRLTVRVGLVFAYLPLVIVFRLYSRQDLLLTWRRLSGR